MKYLLYAVLLLSVQSASALQPFFDNDKSTKYAPVAPQLTALDKDFLKLCGGWGDRVYAKDFEALLNKKQHKDVVERLRKNLHNKIYGKKKTSEEFVHDLRRAWFEQKGFKHIFCGEPEGYSGLGGLHYAPRYWQAQQQKWAGYRVLAKDYRKRKVSACQKFFFKESTRHPIYSISIAYKNKKSSKGVKCLTGYHYEMDAEKLLLAATQAFKITNKRVQKNSKEGCFVETKISGVKPHINMFVIKSRAIRTFYPMSEKKPYCKKNKRNYKACFCSALGKR